MSGALGLDTRRRVGIRNEMGYGEMYRDGDVGEHHDHAPIIVGVSCSG